MSGLISLTIVERPRGRDQISVQAIIEPAIESRRHGFDGFEEMETDLRRGNRRMMLETAVAPSCLNCLHRT
jgi:hypothetical protein